MSAAAAGAAAPPSTYEGEDIVLDIVDEIVDKCGEVLYEHYLRKKQIPYATRGCLVDVFEALTTVYLDSDAGSAEPDVDPSWICEKEPVASQLDAWARGAVATKKPVIKKPKAAAEAEKPQSASSNKKKKHGRVNKELLDEEDDRLQQLVRAGTPSSPRGMLGGNKGMTAKEAANLRELHDVEMKEKMEKEKRQRMIDDALAEINRAEKIMKDLKGKDYTFDHSGNVVMIRKPKPDRMKPMQQNVGVAVVNVNLDRGEPAPVPKKRGRRRKKKKKAPAPDPFADSFQDTAPKQPSIMGDIWLSPGVNITEGQSSKLGPNQLVVPDHMSRKDYNMLHQTLAEKMGADSATEEEEVGEESAEDVSAKTLNPDDLGSIDPMMGAIPGLGAGLPIPADDPNLALTKDPNWGSNVRTSGDDFVPSPVPAKPDDKKKQLTALLLGGEEVRNVRDRPFTTLSPTANRKKLPAPPLGLSTGHGHSASGEAFLPGISVAGESQQLVSKSVPFLTVREKQRGGKMEASVENLDELLA